MERVNPTARRDAYGSRINRAPLPLLVYTVPSVSVILASILTSLPVASAVPFMPPLGFMTLLAWRLTRPGLFAVWAGFPLGLTDDLLSGQPFGSAALLWSLAMITIEIIETRLPWRSFVQDWLTVAGIIVAYLLVSALLAGTRISLPATIALIPQVVLSLLLFPLVTRMVARLDRLRLMRIVKLAVPR